VDDASDLPREEIVDQPVAGTFTAVARREANGVLGFTADEPL
jgi:hypothetical protein